MTLNLFKFINIPAFILSFAFGMFAVYITMPDTRKIVVYPSPDNIDIMQYKDKANNCFRFKEAKVKCPAKESDISKTPVQI
jgi:hypothetical protein